MTTTPKWAKKRVESGAVIEETVYLEGHAPGLVKDNTKTADENRSENRNRRLRDLTRLVNTDFAAGDGSIRLSYSPQTYARLRESLGRSARLPSPGRLYAPASPLRSRETKLQSLQRFGETDPAHTLPDRPQRTPPRPHRRPDPPLLPQLPQLHLPQTHLRCRLGDL